jgi:antitoxin HicB
MIDDVENGTVGSSFDDFLKEQGTYESTVDQAVKRVLAFQQRRTAWPLLPS